ncbi:MAG: hypothetical protein HZB55_10070 [Deltaproteobacteria bacterium]|nr:hypothetical protein [Deltaproteobacteria bacterium]
MALLAVAGHTALTSTSAALETLERAGESSGTEAAQPLLSLKVARGEDLFGDWSRYPHDFALYGPLTYVLPGLIGRAMGWDGPRIWLAGRFLSLLAGGLVLFLAAVVVRRQGARVWLVVLGVLLLVPVLRIWNIAVTFRPDMPAIALSLLGLVLARGGSRTALWRSLPFFLAALAFKQTALAAPTAVGAALYLDGRRREALLFCVAGGLMALGAVAALAAATHGFFLTHTFGILAASPCSSEWILNNWHTFLRVAPPAVLPGFAFGAQALRGRSEARPLALASGFSLLIATLTSVRVGSDVNYFVEAIVYLVVLAILGTDDWLRRAASGARLGPRLIATGLALTACLISADRSGPSRFPAPPSSSFSTAVPYFRQLTADLGTQQIFPGDVSLAVLADLPHPYSDGFAADYLTKAGRLRSAELVGHVREAKYGYVLLPEMPIRYRGIAFLPDALSRDLLLRFDLDHAEVLEPPGGRARFLLLRPRGGTPPVPIRADGRRP